MDASIANDIETLLRASWLLPFAYVDETDSTGHNLCDATQPHFYIVLSLARIICRTHEERVRYRP